MSSASEPSGAHCTALYAVWTLLDTAPHTGGFATLTKGVMHDYCHSCSLSADESEVLHERFRPHFEDTSEVRFKNPNRSQEGKTSVSGPIGHKVVERSGVPALERSLSSLRNITRSDIPINT